MTDQHPLTNKDLEDLEKLLTSSVLGQLVLPSDFELARAAADWQLEKVIKWLKDHAAVYMYEAHDGPCFDEDGLLDDFKKAMRPQEDN